MKARDLERLLAWHGVSSSKMAAITRALRHGGHLEVRGRGANAPDLDATAAATILVAVAGSGKAVDAERRFRVLKDLVDVESGRTLLEAMTDVIDSGTNSDNLIEVRVGRNVRIASFVYADRTVAFQRRIPRDYRTRGRAEFVLPFALLHTVSTFIRTKASVPDPLDTDEPDDDA